MGSGVHFYNRCIVKHVRKSVLLWYSPREMYDLVTAIDSYPQFLPWCDSALVLETHADGVTARLGLAYMGVRHAFTTRNLHVAPQSVTVQLVDGPFSVLAGTWLFKPLGRPGGWVPVPMSPRRWFISPPMRQPMSTARPCT